MTGETTQQTRDWRPAYVRAAEDLRDRILNGEFAAGAAIPSEPVLADEYGISRTSLRNAVRQLRDWGLVEARQGAGTFVRPRAEALFDGLAVDGQSEDEQALVAALISLDPRYARCDPDQDLRDLLIKGRVPVVSVTDYLKLPAGEQPQRWLNALLWSAEHDRPNVDVSSTAYILSIRIDVTTPITAARAIHAVVTA